MKKVKAYVVMLALVLGVVGCANQGSTVKTKQGAVAGGLGGAVIGGIIGHQSGRGLEGAAIGGAIGAAGGAVAGSSMDEQSSGQ